MHTPYQNLSQKTQSKLYRADYLDILADLPENSVDMIFSGRAVSALQLTNILMGQTI